jgi:hypothetical protein
LEEKKTERDMISFQYFSDLHLERYLFIPKLNQIADNLILAGDIGHPGTELYKEFFSIQSKKYNNIYLVHGNHEITYLKNTKNKFIIPFKNVHLLNNDYIIHENKILIAGSILWTPNVDKNENDKSIKFFTNIILNNEYDKKIFISHHLPSYRLIVKKYQNWNNVNRYANNLDYLMNTKGTPQHWICGHSHCILNKKIYKTMCHINTFSTKYDSMINY